MRFGRVIVPRHQDTAAMAWLAPYSGALIRLSPALSVVETNQLGAELMLHCAPGIRMGGEESLSTGEQGVAMCEIPGKGVNRSFELTFVPAGADILVLGRDTSLERRMHAALVESRQRYQDLVAISGDFAWETDRSGAFIFVSPKGALGYTAAELIGRRPVDLLGDAALADTVACFSCKAPVQDVIVWLHDSAGAAVCLKASALPVRTAMSDWAGARGICQNVTEQMDREAELANIRLREQTAAAIAGRMRDEVSPNDMLTAAVSALGRALGAAAEVFTADGGRFTSAASIGSIAPAAIEAAMHALANSEELIGPTGELMLLARTTSYHGQVNGAILLARPVAGEEWDDNDRQLLEAAARQLGIALRQIHDQRELHRLSNTDPLTGLLNRRAFNMSLRNGIAKTRQSGGGVGALIYVDLDNFKPINDELGHAQGDAALCAVAAILSGMTQEGELAARLGGDEFALWLGNVDMAGSKRNAEAIRAEVESIGKSLGAPTLGTSIGIAMLDDSDDADGADILSRADAAMYEAKHGGKGRYAVAATPTRKN